MLLEHNATGALALLKKNASVCGFVCPIMRFLPILSMELKFDMRVRGNSPKVMINDPIKGQTSSKGQFV